MVNGFPRAILDREVGPLAPRTKHVGNAVEDIRKCEGPGAANTRNIMRVHVVQQNVEGS